MIINFDNYKKVPVIYRTETDNLNYILSKHDASRHFHIDDLYSSDSDDFRNRTILSDNTSNGLSEYLRNFYDEQRQMEIANDHNKYTQLIMGERDINEIEYKGE